MMILPHSTRHRILDDLGDFRKAFEKVMIVTVTVAQSGYEPFTDSALGIPDATNGTGLIPTFSISYVNARWNVIDLPAINPFEGIPPGVESGDYLVWIGKRDYGMMKACQDSAYSYIEIDKQTFRLQGVSPDGIGLNNEYRFIARKHKPVFERPE